MEPLEKLSDENRKILDEIFSGKIGKEAEARKKREAKQLKALAKKEGKNGL